MNWLEKIVKAHTDITDNVSHGGRLQSDRYFVWQESGGNDLSASNGHKERAVEGSTDLFTKKEFDPWKGAFERSMTKYGIAWRLESIQFEEDTGFTHYEWYWNVS